MDPTNATGRGRPGLAREIEEKVETMARDGVKPSAAVAAMAQAGTKVSTTKVYEIYRRVKSSLGS